MNEKEFRLSLAAAHKFLNELGIAEPLTGPISLPVNQDFNRIALDTELPYVNVFFTGLKIGHYNFRLTDFSYFQFSYVSEEDLRFAFYPSPFTSDGMTTLQRFKTKITHADDDVEMLMTFAESTAVNYRRPLVRYEYNTGQYDAGVHPVSHLHIGTYGDDRWPLLPRLTPLAFTLLIAKLYFRPYWEAVTEVTNETRKNEFDDLLSRERRQCAPTPEEKFTHEFDSFHFL